MNIIITIMLIVLIDILSKGKVTYFLVVDELLFEFHNMRETYIKRHLRVIITKKNFGRQHISVISEE